VRHAFGRTAMTGRAGPHARRDADPEPRSWLGGLRIAREPMTSVRRPRRSMLAKPAADLLLSEVTDSTAAGRQGHDRGRARHSAHRWLLKSSPSNVVDRRGAVLPARSRYEDSAAGRGPINTRSVRRRPGSRQRS